MDVEYIDPRSYALLVPADKCQRCAHDKRMDGMPCDAASLPFQYWFYKERGRWPCWNDSLNMPDVDPAIRAMFLEEITKAGIDPSDPAQVRGPKKS